MDEFLVLEAALTMCEGKVPSHLTNKLHAFLNEKLDTKYPIFDDFLNAQKKAVEAMSKDPILWGGWKHHELSIIRGVQKEGNGIPQE